MIQDGRNQFKAYLCSNNDLNHPVWGIFLKRVIDIIISISFLILLLPLLIIIAVIIKFTGTGPIFYYGKRTGLYGKPFKIIKFRTMVIDAEVIGGPTTGTDDPRVCRFGRFLRKSKLDEIPQLINVLLGQMSLVGPRPEVEVYTSRYIGEEKLILLMRPGITDYSSLKFADLDNMVGVTNPDNYYQEYILPVKNQLRIKYVKEWNLKSDFSILWMTLRKVLKNIIH